MAAGGRRVSGSRRKQRLQRGLVVVQFAVSLVLLAGAGLLTRTIVRLSKVDTGLSADNVLTMRLTLLARDQARSDKAAVQVAKQRVDEIRREIAALPGVTEVGVGGTLPLRRSGVVNEVKAEGRPVTSDEALPRADQRSGDPSYFSAAGFHLLKGRMFRTTDRDSGQRVVIINQALAERLFPNEDPIGRRIAFTGPVIRLLYREAEDQWFSIVGVVGNTRDGELDTEPQPVTFMPQSQFTVVGAALVIRAANASMVIPAAMRIVRRVAPATLIEDAMTLQQFKDQSVSPRRLNAVLISLFGALALILAGVGIAGVLAFSVSARTNEIGIRMSLGADRGAVERMILGEGGRLVVMGLLLGVAGALASGRLIRGLLFGIEPNDPLTFAGAAVVMAAIGIMACWIPALRAARVDPAITMRAQ
jgi:putative ABC transport system permease protein